MIKANKKETRNHWAVYSYKNKVNKIVFLGEKQTKNFIFHKEKIKSLNELDWIKIEYSSKINVC